MQGLNCKRRNRIDRPSNMNSLVIFFDVKALKSFNYPNYERLYEGAKIAKMESAIHVLFREFHVGLCVIDEFQNLKDDRIICDSISAFNVPVLFIQKPDKSQRIVIKYRKINKNIELHSFTLPNINDILHFLAGAAVFSTLDLKSAYFQIPLDNEFKQLTAFGEGDRKYEYTHLPFGLAMSPIYI